MANWKIKNVSTLCYLTSLAQPSAIQLLIPADIFMEMIKHFVIMSLNRCNSRPTTGFKWWLHTWDGFAMLLFYWLHCLQWGLLSSFTRWYSRFTKIGGGTKKKRLSVASPVKPCQLVPGELRTTLAPGQNRLALRSASDALLSSPACVSSFGIFISKLKVVHLPV